MIQSRERTPSERRAWKEGYRAGFSSAHSRLRVAMEEDWRGVLKMHGIDPETEAVFISGLDRTTVEPDES